MKLFISFILAIALISPENKSYAISFSNPDTASLSPSASSMKTSEFIKLSPGDFALPTGKKLSFFEKVASNDDYLKKSKNQKTTAWILLGGGAALIGAGYLIDFTAAPGSFDDIAKKGAVVAVGAISSIVSIPFFIASAKNKRRAMAATAHLEIQGSPAFQGPTRLNTLFPAASIKISL